MPDINITFPDGSKKQYRQGITPLEILKGIGPRLEKDAIVARVDDRLVDLTAPINKDASLKVITFKDSEGKEIFRHSASHILASAVKRIFPKAKLTIGPAIEDGFYYDFDFERPFTPEDMLKIEDEMKKIVEENAEFKRIEVSSDEAKKKFKELGEEYKLELIQDLGDEQVSVYTHGNFVDLCRGPHISHTGKVKAFQLMKIAGAYWRGKAENKQLQRIYGVAFPEKNELKEYLKILEEAEKRDHRKIGKDLDLFMMHEYAPGAPFFLKKGAIIYNILVDFIRNEYRQRGYEEVITPQLYNKKLWEISGHWEHYKDNMFIVKVEGQEHSLKPMNCPSHCLIYNRDVKSYKDLPIRIADFCNLHRNEFSGTLAGLMRVRKFAQDDAHIFCRFDQIESEVLGVLEFIKYVWNGIFSFKLTYYLSTMPEKALGTKELWGKAETLLKIALDKAGISFQVKPGEGAFYGPKIDIDIEDALGRKWQCPTCQLDFNLPHRFENMYVDEEGKKQECVMIHRAVLGSLERFFGIMVEHYAGKFPLWLSPIQARIVTVADRFENYANKVRDELKNKGFRVEVDCRAESIPKKVREAQVEKIPLIITVGEKEEQNNTVAPRTLDGKVRFGVKIGELISLTKKNVDEKKITIEL